MKKNERMLLFVTIAIGLLAVLYSYVIEPCIKPLFVSGVNRDTNKKYIEIWIRKDDIRGRSKQIFSSRKPATVSKAFSGADLSRARFVRVHRRPLTGEHRRSNAGLGKERMR